MLASQVAREVQPGSRPWLTSTGSARRLRRGSAWRPGRASSIWAWCARSLRSGALAAARCRSPRRGWAACSIPLSAPTGAGGGGCRRRDEVFLQMVLARVIEPVSKLDSQRVLEEAGVAAASCRSVTRRLRAYAKESWRQKVSTACAAAHMPGSARPAWCSTTSAGCISEPNAGDGFRRGRGHRTAARAARSLSAC